MREMKDSGIEWIGEVPAEWGLVKNKHLFEIEKEIVGEDYKSLKVLSLSINGVIERILDGSGKMPSDFGTYQVVEPNTLLLCLFDMDVTPRTVGYVEKEGIVSPAYTKVISNSNKEVFMKYYYYWYLMLDNKKTLLHLAKNLRNSISNQLFREIKVVLPPLEEQQRIANFLDDKTSKIDSLITTKEKQIELLNEYKQSLISETVTKGLNPDVKMKDSGVEWIGEIPENWTLKKVKYLADPNQYYPIGDGDHGSIKPEMYQEEGIPYIRVQNLTWGNELDFNGMVYISEEVNEANKKSILRPKDILIAKTGTVGKTAILPEEIKVANTTSSVGKVSVDHKKYYYKYVAYFFQSYLFKQQINLTAYQKSVQPGFNIDDLIEYQVVLPLNLKEQQQIADFLDKKTSQIDLLSNQLQVEINKLKEYKQSLIFESVTGKLS